MIDLRLLRYFVVVAETEHVGRAAELLHISQSPLSRQIRQLEGILSVALFERANRRIRLTAAGRRLLEPARDLLGRAEAFVRDSRTYEAKQPPRIAIGFVGTAITTGVLPRALRTLRARHPDARLELRHANTETQLELLRRGELDLAFVHTPSSTRGLEVTRVLDQPYRLAVARRARIANQPLEARTLADQPWIAVSAGQRVRERWLLACAAVGFTPRIAVEVADYASALALVEAGVGIALFPDSQRASAPPSVMFRALPWLRARSELWAVVRPHASPLATEVVATIA